MVAALLAGLASAGTAQANEPAAPPSPKPAVPAAVTAPATSGSATANATAGGANAAKTAGCLIEPERWADVGSPVVGIVEQISVDRGDSVRQGQVLVKLRSGVEQAAQTVADTRARTDAEVRAAEVAKALAEQKHQRAQTLQAKAFISPQALEQSRSELDLARHRLTQAQVQQRIWSEESRLASAQLGQRTVRSPFEGIVAERWVSAGERVDERPLLRVAVVNPLRVELMVPAAHWGRLKSGDSLAVQPELPGASATTARVSQIDRMLDPASNTFRVRLTLPNPGHQLPAGLRCRVDLESLSARAPATAPNGAGATPAALPVKGLLKDATKGSASPPASPTAGPRSSAQAAPSANPAPLPAPAAELAALRQRLAQR